MDIKTVEFAQVEQSLKKLGVALESLYKANTKKDEKDLKKLDKKLKKFQYDLTCSSKSLSDLEKELASIQAIYLPGVSAQVLSSQEALSDLIGKKIKGGNQNNQDIEKLIAYQNLSANKFKIAAEIKKIQDSITDVKSKILDKEVKSNEAKERFANDWTNRINNLCEKGKLRVQKIKVSLAGDTVTLKSNAKELSTISFADLKKLNKIALLIETKAKLEILKNSKSASLNKQESYLQKLEKVLEDEIASVNKEEVNSSINAQKAKALKAKKAKVAADKMDRYAKTLGIDSQNAIVKAIASEQRIQETLYTNALEEINRLTNILIDSSKSIGEKKVEIKKAKATLASLEKASKQYESQLDRTTSELLSKLSKILEEQDITAEAGIEKLTEITKDTPYAVRSLTKNK